MKKIAVFTFIILAISVILFFLKKTDTLVSPLPPKHIMGFKSIDTMKYSRDIAREKSKDQVFDKVIDLQVSNIAKTGATHVAIATPYDEEFIPMLRRWVKAARKYNLKVWFRGNFSGWEKWFDYDPIDRETHIQKTKAFILSNQDLFEDGDVFSACPECENGGPGDPRQTGDVQGHRNFLISEYKMTKELFSKIGKKVASNYNSMNADVARKIMDKDTTKALDGLVVIDHYVKTPEQLISDIKEIAKQSGGNVVLGEFGVPIPDINGNMSEKEQSLWLEKALGDLFQMDQVYGVNYWVNTGGSTELWNGAGKSREAVGVISKYFHKIN